MERASQLVPPHSTPTTIVNGRVVLGKLFLECLKEVEKLLRYTLL